MGLSISATSSRLFSFPSIYPNPLLNVTYTDRLPRCLIDMDMAFRTHLNSSWHNVEHWKTLHPPPTLMAIRTRPLLTQALPTPIVVAEVVVIEVEVAPAREAEAVAATEVVAGVGL